eukprot:Gregarina_sp_Poly_1__2389@NODE_163_length_12241_cov_147_232955_g145_i0_p3_GENE_NODE_163_length_12241_cov_147_232955_g145_i0NODE_163_length_12241_cov_147_232955_g145_i0_p3_ORF_typecomplete_len517_score54_22WD40/PF00400_32/0_016WD40/PF00400_32/47WD40/PF00400_32/1_5e08WD40/PF00400_32/3_1e06WD40/PF00400_32/1_1e08WD40/PF00400_32/0_24WD40/PF00400_32/4_6e08ANAPC4_WD40/PF12894_7/2_4e05ANAPC4_WD40/PF12894_7/1_1e07ANAPC4_WD40/PF12894_7/3_2e06ANAPC4_WD40/PF12894_7/0_00014ANAPC4_WD40/PF12894_7/1_6e07ANAPC4_
MTTPSNASTMFGASFAQQKEMNSMFQARQRAMTVSVPTVDSDVRTLLRLRGEPQCLFGEGPFERRERLRTLVAAEGAASVSLPPQAEVKTSSVTEGLFFTEGSEALKEARRFTARYSVPKSYSRLLEHRERFQQEGILSRETERSAYCEQLQKVLRVESSKVGDTRSLTAGKFSADSNYLAVASFSGVVKIWRNDREVTSLCQCEDFHRDRVHGLAWHPHWTQERRNGMENLGQSIVDEESDSTNTQLETNPGQASQPLALATGDAAGRLGFWEYAGKDRENCRLLRQLSGHEDRVNRIDFHPSGRFMATSSHDETWRWWDVETGTELLIQEGHARGVYALRHHPDGSLLVSSDLGGVVRVWDLRIGRSIITLTGHVKQVLGLDFHPISTHIVASCSGDRSVRLWDLRKKDCFETVLAHTNLISAVLFEPGQGRFMLTASYDKELRLWATSDYKCFKVLLGHEGFVMGADISQDGRSIASVSYDCTVKLWRSDLPADSSSSQLPARQEEEMTDSVH